MLGGGGPVLGLEERVLGMAGVRGRNLPEMLVAGELPGRDGGRCEPEDDHDGPEEAEEPGHPAQALAAARAVSRRLKTATRARRRASYPAHLTAGTARASTRSKPSRTKNCMARSSTAHANT